MNAFVPTDAAPACVTKHGGSLVSPLKDIHAGNSFGLFA
jgi:hypothetical protein